MLFEIFHILFSPSKECHPEGIISFKGKDSVVALDIGESFTKNEKIIRAKLYGVNNILKSDGDDAIENFKEEND